jgi:hypothetical protein
MTVTIENPKGAAQAAPPPPAAPPPGWYPSPDTGVQRYWDGQAWGDYAPPPPQMVMPVAVTPPMAAQPSRGTNGMAVAALVLGILWGYGVGSILAIIFGAIGRKQCDERGQGGRGLATAGLVLGIIGVVLVAIVILAAASASTSSGNYTY